ncbi:WD repeat-containing protein GTS1 [Sesamum angolense]|uniref:Co-chaperone protein p23-1 n=1 Tax=Sesamum angolense TaxID=2727404 RepID=A0AAE1X859_9LAMI|nr:WD repeat-containing protein GTS1 [Sesamum angolense]
MSRHPEVKWAEREDKVYLTVLLSDAKSPKVKVDPDGTFTFSATAGTDNNLYELKLDLLKVNVEESKINIGVRNIFCVLEKAEQKWWKKLLRGNAKAPHYVKVDWDKWVDEDDDTVPCCQEEEDLVTLIWVEWIFSKFGDMGGLGDDAMGDDFEDSDDEEVKKPEEVGDGKPQGEAAEGKAEPSSSSDDWTSMAVSLSTNAVKLYSPLTGQYLGECKGHSSTINEISFSGPSSPHVLYSCSSDSTLRAWDSRSFQQVSSINAGSSQEVFSFSFGGAGDNLLAVGCKSQILLGLEDDEAGGMLGGISHGGCHSGDPITFGFLTSNREIGLFWLDKMNLAEILYMYAFLTVHFIPGHQGKLVSASVDGLMCLFDTNGDINDDDHLVSVFNVGTSIGRVGFFGETNQKLWCLTHIETLSVWDWNDSRTDANFEDARTLASESWTLDHVDYFVDCHYSAEEDRLWVIGGTNAGTFGYFPVKYASRKTIGSAEAIFQGGHTGIVRTCCPCPAYRIEHQRAVASLDGLVVKMVAYVAGCQMTQQMQTVLGYQESVLHLSVRTVYKAPIEAFIYISALQI